MLQMGLLLPIGGWLADAFFGRYKVIRCGMWMMWFGAMLNGVSLVISQTDEAYGTRSDPWVSLFSMVIMGIGFGAYQAHKRTDHREPTSSDIENCHLYI